MSITRRAGGALAAIGVATGLILAMPGLAYAGTAVGHSCGEKHPMDPSYYDAQGNAAPCTADFTTSGPGTARITIDVVGLNGISRDDPHSWSLDLDRCTGTVLPSEGPRTFTCAYGPGPHTVYVDKSLGDARVDLRVDY